MSETPTQLAYSEDLDSFSKELDRLKKENQTLRNALSELEAEKVKLAQSYLTTSINIRMLLNNNDNNNANTNAENI
jgi:predicted  nucleic acid-binding Zn-ribbon protein